jgi:carbonic anhydrase
MLPDYTCGGDNWDLEFNKEQQTPIDVPKEVEYEPAVELDLLYKEMTNVALTDNFWTVQLSVPKEKELGHLYAKDLNGEGMLHYVFQQFHFHSPSEHKVNGKRYDLELHFVHSIHDSDLEFYPEYKEVLAVVGVFFELAEKSHPFIEKLKVKSL